VSWSTELLGWASEGVAVRGDLTAILAAGVVLSQRFRYREALQDPRWRRRACIVHPLLVSQDEICCAIAWESVQLLLIHLDLLDHHRLLGSFNLCYSWWLGIWYYLIGTFWALLEHQVVVCGRILRVVMLLWELIWWLTRLIVYQNELLVCKHWCEVWLVAHLLTMSTFGTYVLLIYLYINYLLNHLGLSTVASFFCHWNFWFHLRFLAASADTHGLLVNLYFCAYSHWILFLILERMLCVCGLESERLEVSSPAVCSRCWMVVCVMSQILPLGVCGWYWAWINNICL